MRRTVVTSIIALLIGGVGTYLFFFLNLLKVMKLRSQATQTIH